MFETIKSNLEMAIRLKDKNLFDIATSSLDLQSLSCEDLEVFCELQNEMQHALNLLRKPITAPNPPVKECLLDDPACENCSS